MKIGVDDFLVKEAAWPLEAYKSLERIPLTDDLFIDFHAWYQNWERKQATDELCNAPACELWPEMDEAAYYGLPGEFVRAVEPYSEADPAGILLTLLSALGCMVGTGPHAIVEYLPHPPRLNVLLVGRTAGGRKGTTWNHPRRLLSSMDPAFITERVKSGLNSGEGLVYQVRDAEGNDPGVSDKRLFILESEFASVLKVLQRDGNTLSPKIRDAWDCGNLTPLTKHDRLTATDAHIAIVGQITQAELIRLMAETERMNGFANRFLVALVRRSKLIPSGKGAPDHVLSKYLSQFPRVYSECRHRLEIARDGECEALWAEVYPSIEEELPGVAGAILARGAAQVLRLSLIYSLFDEAEAFRPDPAIRIPHLMAALAVWEYCKASVFHIFGDALGDPVADKILAIIKDGPKRDTDLYEAIGKHAADQHRKEMALNLLMRLNLVHFQIQSTAGRSARWWHAGKQQACALCAKRV